MDQMKLYRELPPELAKSLIHLPLIESAASQYAHANASRRGFRTAKADFYDILGQELLDACLRMSRTLTS